MIIRKTRPEERRHCDELFAIAFEMALDPNTDWDKPEDTRFHHWAAFEDDDRSMMSTFTVTDFQIRFDGSACKMGGIGGVATLPQYRRRGGIRGCFQAALPDMYENGYDFSYLYPFSTAYYRKFGYETCVNKLHWTVQLGQLNPDSVDGTLRMADGENPMTESICQVDSLWENAFNMMVLHGKEDYAWTKKVDPAVSQEFTYVYFDPAGMPKAYTTFKKADQSDGRNLVCSRFVFSDREGFAGLMHLFKSLASDHTYVKFTTPSISELQSLMPEWSLGAVQWGIQPAGMVRVINVKRVLEKARYIGSGSVILEIRDDQIEKNNRRFRVAFSQGRAVSVEETPEKADVCMQITAFSALIAGTADFSAAKRWMKAIEVKKDNPCLDQVFYRKPLMIADYF